MRRALCLVVLSMLVPSSALAADGAHPLVEFFHNEIVPILLSVLGGLLLWVMRAGGAWLTERAKGTLFENVTRTFTEAARSAVARVDVELKPQVLAAMAADSDGGRAITPAEAAKLRAEGLRLLLGGLSPSLRAAAGRFFGGAAGVESYAAGLVERAVIDLKHAQAPRHPPTP